MSSKLPWLLSPKTRRATMPAPGATPWSVGSLAAIRPATPVPCCQVGQDAVGAAGEVEPGDDLVPGPEAAAERRVVVIHAGVDDGDGHARCRRRWKAARAAEAPMIWSKLVDPSGVAIRAVEAGRGRRRPERSWRVFQRLPGSAGGDRGRRGPVCGSTPWIHPSQTAARPLARPPRVTVVNAPLPWRDRPRGLAGPGRAAASGGRSSAPDPSERMQMVDRAGPSTGSRARRAAADRHRTGTRVRWPRPVDRPGSRGDAARADRPGGRAGVRPAGRSEAIRVRVGSRGLRRRAGPRVASGRGRRPGGVDPGRGRLAGRPRCVRGRPGYSGTAVGARRLGRPVLSTPLVSDGTPAEFSPKHGNRRRDPGPVRFNPAARQTPPVRHRQAPDPARRRGRPASRHGSTG